MAELPPDAHKRLAAMTFVGRAFPDVLDDLAFISLDSIEQAEAISITLVRGRGATAAQTSDLALELDEIQYEIGHGPCLDSGRSGTFLEITDMAAETRWPDYVRRAVATGVRASMSVPLPMQTEAVGALNVYSRRAHAFDDDARGLAKDLAASVAVACVNAQAYGSALEAAEQMQAAMATRAVIEQAKGVIMAQNRCSPDAAFEILRLASMNRNLKLRDLAQSIVASVEKPD